MKTKRVCKQVTALCLALVLCLAMLLPACAEDGTQSGMCGENLTWTLEDGTLTISGTGAMNRYHEKYALRKKYTLRTDISSLPDAPWYAYRDSVRRLVLDAGVTLVYAGTFYFPNLTAVSVSTENPQYSHDENGVLYNKDKTALYLYPGAAAASSYAIPNTVTQIQYLAFSECTQLREIRVPSSVTTVDQGAFKNCTSLQSVTLEEGVQEIEDSVFWGCVHLKDIHLPQSLYAIGEWAFYDAGLERITIPDNVWDIGIFAFYSCKNLKQVQLPTSLSVIPYEAFAGCEALQEVSIPAVYTVESAAFMGCTQLREIVLPETVEEIGKNAFAGCTSLEKVTLLSTELEWVGEDILSDTPFYADASNWEDGVLYLGCCLLRSERQGSGNYTVKDGTRVIACKAFQGSALTGGVILPDSVVAVGDFAFAYSTIRFVHFPKSFRTIGSFILWSGIRGRSYAYICCESATGTAYAYAAENDVRFYSCSGSHSGFMPLWRSTWLSWKLYTMTHQRMAANDAKSVLASLGQWLDWKIGNGRQV